LERIMKNYLHNHESGLWNFHRVFPFSCFFFSTNILRKFSIFCPRCSPVYSMRKFFGKHDSLIVDAKIVFFFGATRIWKNNYVTRYQVKTKRTWLVLQSFYIIILKNYICVSMIHVLILTLTAYRKDKKVELGTSM